MSKIEILEDVKVEELKPYENNIFSHEHNVSDIISSIRDFGYSKVSIGMDEENVLLYGHGTLEALKLIGWVKVPKVARITGLNEEQKRGYRIADNTTANGAVIIRELLRKEAAGQKEFDFADYGMNLADVLSIGNETPGELDKTSKEFLEDNPDIPKKEKMWMYIEFNTPEDWEKAIAFMARGSSRRVLDENKFMEVISGKV